MFNSEEEEKLHTNDLKNLFLITSGGLKLQVFEQGCPIDRGGDKSTKLKINFAHLPRFPTT